MSETVPEDVPIGRTVDFVMESPVANHPDFAEEIQGTNQEVDGRVFKLERLRGPGVNSYVIAEECTPEQHGDGRPLWQSPYERMPRKAPAELQEMSLAAVIIGGGDTQQARRLLFALQAMGAYSCADALALGEDTMFRLSLHNDRVPHVVANERGRLLRDILYAATGHWPEIPARADRLLDCFDDIAKASIVFALPYGDIEFVSQLGLTGMETIGSLMRTSPGELGAKSTRLTQQQMVDFVLRHVMNEVVKPFNRGKAARATRQ